MIKNFLSDDEEPESQQEVESNAPKSNRSDTVISLFDEPERPTTPANNPEKKEPFILSDEPPVLMEESIRQSGLAYSAGIAFFAAVVFMLVLGWGADVLLGTSPWGIVVGIVLGSVIGFVQFFRITSQIFKK